MSVTYAALVDDATEGIELGGDVRARAREVIDRALDAATGETTAPEVDEDEIARQNGEALQGLMDGLKGVRVAGK